MLILNLLFIEINFLIKLIIFFLRSKIEIDFDPYQDNACDNVVSITVNGKTIIHKY